MPGTVWSGGAETTTSDPAAISRVQIILLRTLFTPLEALATGLAYLDKRVDITRPSTVTPARPASLFSMAQVDAGCNGNNEDNQDCHLCILPCFQLFLVLLQPLFQKNSEVCREALDDLNCLADPPDDGIYLVVLLTRVAEAGLQKHEGDAFDDAPGGERTLRLLPDAK